MGLSTNGWDYILNYKLSKLQTFIDQKTPELSKLVEDMRILPATGPITDGFTDIQNLGFEILPSSSFPFMYAIITIGSCKYYQTSSTYNLNNIKISLKINLNWLNRCEPQLSVAVPTPSTTDIQIISVIQSGFAPTFITTIFINRLKSYLTTEPNPISAQTVPATVPRNYNKYYKLLSATNEISVTPVILRKTTQRFSFKIDAEGNCLFAICCMIDDNSNQDVGYVDVNAIPQNNTAALVIDRSVFAEKMVKELIKKLGSYVEKINSEDVTLEINLKNDNSTTYVNDKTLNLV